jgi:hypothetical protein
MAMQKPLHRSLNTLFILVLITLICACGGDKKKKNNTPITSTAVVSSTALSSATSKAVTSSSAVISSTAATSSAASSTAPDSTPNTFSFVAVTDALPNSINTSAVITVAGINVAVPISITGGTYAIGAGAFTNVAGTISVGQTVTVKTTAAATPVTAVDAVLTIGGVSATYKITTVADTLAPTAKILFPPIVSMTEGNTILVRGTASAAYAIKSVKVNGVTATTTDNFANWQALVPLTDKTVPVMATTENLLTVMTENNAGIVAVDAAHVAIRQAPITSSFPDGDNPFLGAWGLAIDRLDGRNRLLVTGTNADKTIKSIDLTTGKRTVFAILPSGARGIVINAADKRVYTAVSNSDIIDFDLTDATQVRVHSGSAIEADSLFLDTTNTINKWVRVSSFPVRIETADELFSTFTILSDGENNIPDAINLIKVSSGAALDKIRKRYLVTDAWQQTIFAVDATTGVRNVFSNKAVGTGDAFGDVDIGNIGISAIVVDEVSQHALVFEDPTGKIFSVDLVTGNRLLISSVNSANSANVATSGYGIAISDPNGYAFLSNSNNQFRGIIAVDLITGHRVVFSK